MGKIRGGNEGGASQGSKPSKPKRLSDSSAAEQSYLKGTQRLGRAMQALPDHLAQIKSIIEEYQKEGIYADPNETGITIKNQDGTTFQVDLPFLEGLRGVLPKMAEHRLKAHQESHNPVVRRLAARALQPDRLLSDASQEKLIEDLNKKADNF